MTRPPAALLRPFLPAKDFAESLRFYDLLGFERAFAEADLALYVFEGGGFFVQAAYEKAWAENLMLQLTVDDLDAWWAHIDGLDLADRFGVRAPKPPAMQPWGLREVHVIDPAGVCWHVCQRPDTG